MATIPLAELPLPLEKHLRTSVENNEYKFSTNSVRTLKYYVKVIIVKSNKKTIRLTAVEYGKVAPYNSSRIFLI